WAALEEDSGRDAVQDLYDDEFERERAIPRGAVRQLDYPTWERHIEAIRGAIRSGAYDKIVAARMATIEPPVPFDDLTVARNLAREYPHCHLFAFRRPGVTFVGASPENLFRR